MKIYKSYFFLQPVPAFHIVKLVCCLLLLSLQLNAQPSATDPIKTGSVHTDYSNMIYWAAHPWKTDPSDSVPAPLKHNNAANDSLADVFFIHPTTFTSKKFTSWNASVDDEILNLKTDNGSILYQASVFNENCRVFAPRYRQANIKAFFIPDEQANAYFDTAYEDIKAAFEYYLIHFNKGRPIIIAAHSQGTLHAGRLLKEFFEGKLLMNKLVCAYIIGMPLPETYFSILKPCDNPDATGCYVGWRTFKKGYEPAYVKKENFKSVVVNPITWKLNDSLASSKLNKGGLLKNFNKIVPSVVNARVHGNILWSCKPNVFGKIFFFRKNFHIGDINLFYMNIRENVKTRISAYRLKMVS